MRISYTGGYYHTGMDSWDWPRIDYFARSTSMHDKFEHGPFKTHAKAKAHLLEMMREQRRVIMNSINWVKQFKE